MNSLILYIPLVILALAFVVFGGKLWRARTRHRAFVRLLDNADALEKVLHQARDRMQAMRKVVGRVAPDIGAEAQASLDAEPLVQQLLRVAGYRRMPLPVPMLLFRPLTPMLFNWWYWPAISRYFMDRFFVPEIADHDAVYRQFGFKPARIRDTISYLRRSRLGLRIFRR